ncbi:MAG: family 10 glycosylhydrolase [Verrucomicrobiales bacterium]
MPPMPRQLLALAALALVPTASAQEFRALWADTFHAGLRNAAEVTALVTAARRGNCNAVVVEVRKRGDAYYRNGLEPTATDVAAGFDPLADLVQKAHSGSPRIDVHAWMVTYNIWNNGTEPPSQPTHPYNLHPDWLTQRNDGQQFDGSNYQFDPGHPGVQEHTFAVAMDILTRYNVDGIHFDYIRYTEHDSAINNQPWGYNPLAVSRFKTLKSRTTTPAPSDPVWLQWRRDQVTALLRKVYLHAWAAKPAARVSAALIPWGNAPDLSLASWQSTNAYARVLQDWRGWMEEGILDLACPMIYRNEETTPGFEEWADFAKERQYNRAAAIGMGWYLNTVSNTIEQIKLARLPTAGGKRSVGVVGYSYAVMNRYPDPENPGGYINNFVPRNEMLDALREDAAAETYDPGGSPVFLTSVALPAMPWKTNSMRGHLMGFVREAPGGTDIDGATLTLSGPAGRTLLTDATGFFGAVDLPVGDYTLTISLRGFASQTRSFTVVGAQVAQLILAMAPPELEIRSAIWNAAKTHLTLVWASVPGKEYNIEYSTNLLGWIPLVSVTGSEQETTSYELAIAAASATRRFFRVKLAE